MKFMKFWIVMVSVDITLCFLLGLLTNSGPFVNAGDVVRFILGAFIGAVGVAVTWWIVPPTGD